MHREHPIRNVASFAGVAALTWLVLSVPAAGQRSGRSASASVGRLSNTSASANIASSYWQDFDAGVVFDYNSLNAASLMVTDVNDDGHQDIKVEITVPPLGTLSPIMHGFLIVDGATGATITNEVFSQG
jgi:hypothetical protein